MKLTKDKELLAFIQKRLANPRGIGYNPDGNSTNAVLTRYQESYWKALKWEWNDFAKEVGNFFQDIRKGGVMEISVAHLVGVFVVAAYPLSVIIRTHSRKNLALQDYRDQLEWRNKNELNK